MEEERRTDDNNGGIDFFSRLTVGSSSPPPPLRSLPILSPPSAAVGVAHTTHRIQIRYPRAAVGVALNCGLSHILHTVSKFDTLAGVAIKYGVEVADIKRLNGLVTDRQMFALKTLKIPLPRRHPPSLRFCNNHDHSSQRRTMFQISESMLFTYLKMSKVDLVFLRNLSRLEAVSKETKLLFIALYFLIWGEAANVRFLSECLCYIFHHVDNLVFFTDRIYFAVGLVYDYSSLDMRFFYKL